MPPSQAGVRSKTAAPLMDCEPSSRIANKLPGNEGCISGSETLSFTTHWLTCVSPDGYHHSSFSDQFSGQSVFTPFVQSGACRSCTQQRPGFYFWKDLQLGAHKPGIRLPVGAQVVECIWWIISQEFVHLRGVNSLFPMVLPFSFSPCGVGHHGTEVAKALWLCS